jgi:hypothetical protein
LKVGKRSALDWVIDQYQIKTDKRSGITSDPNNADDEEYIVRLVGQVVRVSVETPTLDETDANGELGFQRDIVIRPSGSKLADQTDGRTLLEPSHPE